MLSIQAVCLIAVIVTSAQDAPEMPAAWKQKVEAAGRAIDSGHPIKAEALLAEIVEEAEKLGKDDLRLAEPLGLLAGFYMSGNRKRYAEAEPLLRRALAIREKAQGADHPDVASTLINLAMCRIVADGKQSDAAGPMLRRALAIVEKAKGPDDPEVASVLSDIAMWQIKCKDIDVAEAALTRAVAIREKVLGPGDPQVADLLDSLGAVHAAQCNGINRAADQVEVGNKPEGESKFERHRRQAESFYSRALAIREKALKPDHPNIAESLYNLGQLATMRGRDADAERYFVRWVVLQEKAKAPESERQAKVLMMLATASMARKDFDQAERHLAKAQAVVEEVNGTESTETSMMLSARADNAHLAARFDDVERFLKRSLEVQAALIGRDDADVKQARVLMAGRYLDHVDDRRAPVLWHRMKVLGDEARWRRQHGELDDILESYASLLRRTNRVLPRPTEEDLAYLKKVGAMISAADLDYLTKTYSVIDGSLDDEGLAHIARLYDIERLSLHNQSITDAGLPISKTWSTCGTSTSRGVQLLTQAFSD